MQFGTVVVQQCYCPPVPEGCPSLRQRPVSGVRAGGGPEGPPHAMTSAPSADDRSRTAANHRVIEAWWLNHLIRRKHHRNLTMSADTPPVAGHARSISVVIGGARAAVGVSPFDQAKPIGPGWPTAEPSSAAMVIEAHVGCQDEGSTQPAARRTVDALFRTGPPHPLTLAPRV